MKFFWSLGCSDKAAVLAAQSVPVRFVDFLETGADSLGRDGATVESSAERNTCYKSTNMTSAQEISTRSMVISPYDVVM